MNIRCRAHSKHVRFLYDTVRGFAITISSFMTDGESLTPLHNIPTGALKTTYVVLHNKTVQYLSSLAFCEFFYNPHMLLVISIVETLESINKFFFETRAC